MLGFSKGQLITAAVIIVAIVLYSKWKQQQVLNSAQQLILDADPFTSGAVL